MKSIKVERVRLFPNVGNFRTILSSPCLSSTFALTDFSLQMMLFFLVSSCILALHRLLLHAVDIF